MRRLHLERLLPIFTVFLIAPSAWGYSEKKWSLPSEPADSYASLQTRLSVLCAHEFREHFAAWSRIGVRDAQTLGETLCAEGRIFWPFVEVRDPAAFRDLSDFVPAQAPEAMIFGVATGLARDNSEVLHALRHSLYPSSAMLMRWTDNPGALREWLVKNHGGRFGGVIYAVIDGQTPELIEEQIARAKRAIAYVSDPANGLTEFTLVVDNRVAGLDLRSRVAVQRWIALSSRDCQADL